MCFLNFIFIDVYVFIYLRHLLQGSGICGREEYPRSKGGGEARAGVQGQADVALETMLGARPGGPWTSC